jgi:4-hydroxy-2-oxoheptanedioate aldolase
MRSNPVLTALRAGRPSLGLWISSYHPQVVRLLASAGVTEWMTLDGEHSPIDSESMALCCGAIADVSQAACAPLVRVADGTVDQIKRALDGGAFGVVVPLVNSAEQAAQIVRFAKYPPMGVRGNGGMLPHIGFGATRPEYTARANSETAVIVQIETREAVDNIDAIVAVPGVDCAFIGPNDLHISYGHAPSYWSDAADFREACRNVVAACKRAGVAAGILCANGAQARDRIADGFTLVGYGSDVGILLSAAAEHRNTARA